MTSSNSTGQDLPYIIAESETLGRYMIAARDLRLGEIIFEESPLASGPQIDSPLICPGCYKIASSECPKCGWPICSEECSQKSRHETHECHLLTNTRNPELNWSEISDSLMLYRCLTLPKDSPQRKALLGMESHKEKWIGSLAEKVECLVSTLRKYFQLTPEDFSTEEIYLVQAILFINAFEVRMPQVNIQAIYHLCCLLEHNCLPNTHRSISSETLVLTVRAARDLPKGTHLSTSYCDIFWPTRQRQDFLQWSKFFLCQCERCLEPNEFGSLLSAFVCPICPNIAPVIPDLAQEGEKEIVYNCTKCGNHWDFIKSGLEDTMKKAESELEELESQDESLRKSDEILEWIKRWSIFPTNEIIQELRRQGEDMNQSRDQNSNFSDKPEKWVLHPQHSIVWDACHTLFLEYSYGEDTPKEEMLNKVLLGEHILQSTANITKGISKFRGSVLCELAMTRLTLFNHQLDSGIEMDQSIKTHAKESLQMMKEGLENLKYEPLDQPEGSYYEIGLRQFTQFQNLLAEVLPDLVT